PFYEEIGGYRISGDVDFTFPAGTIIPGGGFIVIAKVPEDIQAIYGISNVTGPYTNSLKATGTVRLRNERDAILLEVDYRDTLPWPVAANGAGHSMVLARPSYGEAYPQAWAHSDVIGGSPGQVEAFRPSPLRNVVINEFLAHTDDPALDFIELYNHANQGVDISGCFLSDDASTNKFMVPPGTMIPARGFISFDQNQLGFSLSSAGEKIFFVNSNATRVIDAISFDAQANGVSSGRFPDGAAEIFPLASPTPGAANSGIRIHDVVINEIMYAPISGNSDDEYIELYNRGTNPVSLANWRFVDGIDFTFATNTVLATNAYLVIARNVTNLLAKYPTLNSNNTVGNWEGSLANKGERIALAIPDQIITTNSSGNPRTNIIYIVVNEVSYGTGGRWGSWAKEGGSSLELIDPESNHRLAYNWADSDETTKAPWTLIEYTGVLDQGSTYNSEPIDRLELMLLGEGECLIDNVEVVGPGSTNRIVNSTFETGLSGWTPQGNHVRSTPETTEGYLSSQSLHVRASSRGDTGANRIRTPINGALASGNTATLRMRARWLRGWPEPLMRLKGNYLEATGRMTLPSNLGTPGARNSRWAANTGPAIYEVMHTPVVPGASEDVVVTARVHDPDGVSAFTVKYRVDPNASYTTVNMLDNGTGGDAIANDGIFSATIPGQSAGTMVAFYVEATDGLGAVNQLPRGASPTGPECLVRFGDPMPTSTFGTYRQWLTQNNVNAWINRPSLSNERVEGTFVYGNFRAIHNMGSRYAGSPYHQGFSSPLGNCHYSMELPFDDLLLGTENFNKVHAPGNGAFDDDTIQREQTGYWMARQIGLPWNYRRYVAMFVNGNRRGTLMEDTQTPGSDVIESLFPDDQDGDLFKLQPWFEFDDVNVTGGAGAGFNNKSWCVLNNYLTTGNVKKQARFRWSYLVRAADTTANNYTNAFNLVDAASTATNGWTNFVAKMEALVDMEQWLRIFGVEHAVGNWDSFGNRNSQNMYGYKPEFGKWQLLIWDYNIILGNSGSDGPTGDNLFQYQTADTNMVKIYDAPPFRRAYWRALKDVADGPMNNANVDPVMDAKYAAFAANGITVTSPSAALKGWISSRRSYLLSQLATVNAPFATGNDFSTNNNLITLTGTAPVGVKTIKINGIAYATQWSSVSNWTIFVPIGPGANLLALQGYDTYGNAVAGASDAINVTNTGSSAVPEGNVVINEIMYNPAVADASFVEIHNIHPTVTFDLSNWRLEGADFTFTEGTIIRPGGFAVVANDPWAFAAAYGGSIPLAGVFDGSLDNGGETLRLIKPGVTPDLDQLIDEVRYDDDLPWPMAADGLGPSLQLIDPTQDNYRAGNWAAVPTNAAPPYYTPGATNSVRASLAPFPLVWINELQVFNTNGVTDNLGEREPWIELHNNGPTNVSLAGMFLTDSYSNLMRWPFPSAATIAPGQFLLVWADGEPLENSGTNYHMNFRLTNSVGGIALVRTNAGRTNVLDYVNYFALSPDRSFGSYPDGQPRSRQLFHFATPRGTNNPALAPVPAIVNEWMADNAGPNGFPDPADGLFQDWFELFNPNTNTVDLSGYYLTDNLGQPTKFQIPANTMIAPRGYLLVWADNNTAQNGLNADLHANFQLSNNGEAIGLFAPDGTPQSTVTFGQQIQNVSQGRWPDGDTNAMYFMTNFTPRAANVVTSSNAPSVLALVGNKTGNENSLLTFTVSASDPDFPSQTLSFTLDAGAPAGASIHPSTGTFNWAPSETQGPGSYPVTIRVTDNGAPNLSDSETITITVNEVNGVPVLAPIGNRNVNEGSALVFTATASDSDVPANALTFSLDPGAPPGAAITPLGAFSWTPSEGQGPGSYPITVRVTDNGTPALSDSETITVTVGEVNSAPTLNTITNQTINENATLSLTASATDPDLPAQTLTYSITSGPSNATINPSTGAFSWTPNEGQAPSTNSITINVTDDGTPTLNHSRTFTVVVNEVNSSPVLAVIGNKSATEGVTLTFTNSATDPDLPAQTLTFSLDAGAPVGAGITTNGVFTWTPSESQGGTTNSTTIRVTDNGSPALSDFETITITVAEANAAPVLTAIGNKTVNEGSTLAFTATATDSDTPAQSLSYSLDAGAPVGASINPTTGAFTWTPTESQGPSTNAITVRVTDNGSPV
ncbi:MAG TPA: lamin tail domain-containing protein, partial [Candidatus Binatia bacterium]|nr:lamin tail domain-containing protein [Candidatus Binatia bacterium]